MKLVFVTLLLGCVMSFGSELRLVKKDKDLLTLGWDSIRSNKYTLQWSTNLTSWNALITVTATSSVTQVSFLATGPLQYYRLSNWLGPLRANLALGNGTKLGGITPIGFNVTAQNATPVYAALLAWTNGGKTNVIDTLDLRLSPTNKFYVDSTRLQSGVVYNFQMEATDDFGTLAPGANARWILSDRVQVVPTNAVSLLHQGRVGYNFVVEVVSLVTNATWSCVASNSFWNTTWSGIFEGVGKVRVSDIYTNDFTHSYLGDWVDVHVTVVSTNSTNTLVRTLPIDRRPTLNRALVIEDDTDLLGGVYPDLWDLCAGYVTDFSSLNSRHYNLARQMVTNVNFGWNNITSTSSLWGVVGQYIRGDLGVAPNRFLYWGRGLGGVVGDRTHNLSLGFLKTIPASNCVSFSAVGGCNSRINMALVGPNLLTRVELLEWGQYPRLGLSFKGYPFSIGSAEDISMWEATFWKKFREVWFDTDEIGFGFSWATVALEHASTLEDGKTRNPLVDYLEVVGSLEFYCDEIYLTPEWIFSFKK